LPGSWLGRGIRGNCALWCPFARNDPCPDGARRYVSNVEWDRDGIPCLPAFRLWTQHFWALNINARLRKRADRLRGALWQGPGGRALPRGMLYAPGSELSRLPGCAISTRTAHQSHHRPPTRLRDGRTPRETRRTLPVDAVRHGWENGAAINESEKQFSFTRGAPSASGRAKNQIPMCSLRSLTCLQVQVLPRQGMVGPSSHSRLWLGETQALL